MSPTAPPDKETLLVWISAFFDGELSEGEEARLFEAMERDPALEAEFLRMERTLGATGQLAGLADAVMAQVAPQATDDAAPLLSAYLDDEADAAQGARLSALLTTDAGDAREALAFLHAAEGASLTLAALPESPAVLRAVAALPSWVSARVEAEERAEELLSALQDDDATAAEGEELQSLLAGGASPSLPLVHLAEAVSYVVRAPLTDPAAARAGAAALQVLEAERLQASASARSPSAAPSPSLLERARQALGGLFAPLAAAACAAALFVSLQGAPGAGVVEPDSSADDWARTFLPLLEEDLLAANAPADIEVLGDNGGTEVQAIDSGSHMAAVFSTEASAITVIWVPEPSADIVPEETGT